MFCAWLAPFRCPPQALQTFTGTDIILYQEAGLGRDVPAPQREETVVSMTKPVSAAEIEASLVGAVPDELTFTVERSDDTICVTLPHQPGIPWELHIGWEGVIGEGEHLLWIFSDPLKYEEFSLESLDDQALDRFGAFVADLLSGDISVEVTQFRSSGKLWRTRLLDCRQPPGEQVVYRYYRSALRWWRPVRTEIVKLGTKRNGPEV